MHLKNSKTFTMIEMIRQDEDVAVEEGTAYSQIARMALVALCSWQTFPPKIVLPFLLTSVIHETFTELSDGLTLT